VQKSAPIKTPRFDNVNLSDERKVKETYFTLAKFTNDIDPGDSLGYQLRRFGLWHGITSVPNVGKNGCTEMMAVSKDRVFEYVEKIRSDSSVELLKRIEHTIETSPFWLEGNYLSACCAESLNMTEVATAIQQLTNAFLKRLPILAKSKFSDGSEFLTLETASWLKNTEKKYASVEVSSNFDEIYKTKGLEATLNEINLQLETVKEPRESCHLKLLAAEFFKKSGLHSLAKSHFLALEEEVKSMLVVDWEPMFLQRLSNNEGL